MHQTKIFDIFISQRLKREHRHKKESLSFVSPGFTSVKQVKIISLKSLKNSCSGFWPMFCRNLRLNLPQTWQLMLTSMEKLWYELGTTRSAQTLAKRLSRSQEQTYVLIFVIDRWLLNMISALYDSQVKSCTIIYCCSPVVCFKTPCLDPISI